MQFYTKHRDTLFTCLLFLAPAILVALFYFSQFATETDPRDSEKFLDFLVQAPGNVSIYVFASLFIGGWLAWSRNRHVALKRHFRDREAYETSSDLTPRDWWMAYTFRKRGLALRMGAGFILACVFALLLGGLHLILFGLLEIGVRDQRFALDLAQRAQFDERYGKTLQLMTEGRYWFKAATPSLEATATTQVHRVGFNMDGTLGVLSWRSGPILVSVDKGRSWEARENLGLDRGQSVAAMGFSDDGRLGMVVSNEGAAFVTRDRGATWVGMGNVPLKEGDWIGASWFSPDGKQALVIGHKGSVRTTDDEGQAWSSRADLALNPRGSISAAGFSKDGSIGVIGGYKGPVLVSRDRGKSWTLLKRIRLRNTEWLEAAVFSANGKYGVVGGVSGSVFVTQDNGKTWRNPAGLNLPRAEGLSTAVLSEDGKRGLVVGTQGSVFITKDGGSSWARSTTAGLRKGERIAPESQSTFSQDGLHGVIMGSAGTILVTADGGQSWTTSFRFDDDQPFMTATSVPLDLERKVYVAVALDRGAEPYLLEDHDSLDDWQNRPMTEIIAEMRNNLLVSNSQIFSEMATYIANPDRPAIDNTPHDESTNPLNQLLDRLAVARIATMTVLFFLVQILVRLYQYNLRLASFWESRSDAVLLAQSFSDRKAATFDDLVGSLAPDAYDFKAPPRSMYGNAFSWFRRRREP